MNFDSSSKIIFNNTREAQGIQSFTGGLSNVTTPGTGDNPAKSFIDKLLERIQNIGKDSESVEDLLLKRINVFTNLRLVLNDSEIIDYFQKFVDGADIPIEETLDLFALAYDANMKIGKNIREILEFILNHRTWNRNPELTKDIVNKTVTLATSTSTRFFPYFSMLLGASDPGSKDLSSIGMISGLDLEAQQAFKELVNLAAKTDKDTLESIRVQQQAAQDALDVAKDKYSLTRGIVETLEKSSYEERLSKTILKLDQLFRKRYSTPGYRQIKLMMFDLHFGRKIYKELFADLNSSTDLRTRTPRSSKENSRIAFTLNFNKEEIDEFTKQDIEDLDNFMSLANNLQNQDKLAIQNLLIKVKKDLEVLPKDPDNYIQNFAKVMDSFIAELKKLQKLKPKASKFSRIVTAAPPALPAPISAALSALSSIPGVGSLIGPLTSAITSLIPAGASIFSSQMSLFIQTVTNGITAISSFRGIIDVPKVIAAIASGNINDIQSELTKFMNGTAFNATNINSFFDLLKLTALLNRDFSSVVTLMLTQALLKKNSALVGRRPLPSKKVTQQERKNITEVLQNLGIETTKINALIQLKDFRQQTLRSLDNEKELAESFKSITISIPGLTADAPLTGGQFESATKEYYDDLSKSIKMFNYEEQVWESLDKDVKPENRAALSVFLKANVAEIKKDIQIVTKKLGEVYLLGIGGNAQVDVNIRKLEQENIVNKGLFDAEKTQGVQVPLSSIALRENIVEQRAQYDKLLTSITDEFQYLQSAEAIAQTTGDYKSAIQQVENMLGKQLIHADVDQQAVKQEINIRMNALDGMIKNLQNKIINLTTEIINTSEGNRTSMSKFEKIVKDNNELPEKKDNSEIIKEADEVTEDYWNELLPGFGTAMEKPKKWRKKLTEDIPVVMHHTRKWTH